MKKYFHPHRSADAVVCIKYKRTKMKRENQKFICRLFAGKCESAKDLLRAHRLFQNKTFEKQVHSYLEEEWEAFLQEDAEFVDPPGFGALYERTKHQALGQQKKKWPMAGIAASVAVLIAVTVLSFFYADHLVNDTQYAMLEVSAEFGQTKDFYLSDGTAVKLNGGTRIMYPEKITENQRTVFVQGQAYFSERGSSDPLFITTSHLAAAVTGESFVVSAYPDDPEINIALGEGEGSIQSVVPLTKLTPAARIKETDSIEKNYNQQSQTPDPEQLAEKDDKSVRFKKNGGVVERFEPGIHREFFAWTDGEVYLQNANIRTVQQTIRRTYALQLDLGDCLDVTKKINASYAGNNVDELLSMVAVQMEAEIKILEDNKAIIQADCND